MKQLLLVGAGGFGREVAEAVRALNAVRPTWDLLGFLDDSPSLVGMSFEGTPVVGTTAALARFPTAQVVLCTGSPANYFSRKRLADRLQLPPDRYATIVHPQAVVAPSASIGHGTALLATTVITCAATVGAHVAVMPGAVLTHDDEIGDFATLGAGVRLAGGVRVRTGAYLGAACSVRENLVIGAWALVGMGAVVVDSVPDHEVWAGVPARRLRSMSVPAEVA